MLLDQRQPKADRSMRVVALIAVLTIGMVVAAIIVALTLGTDLPAQGISSF